METGTLEKIYENNVNTKFGPKIAYNLVISGEKYSGGFKKPPVEEGQTVKFEHATNARGYKEIKSIFPDSGSGPGTAAAAGGKSDLKVSRERSIIRQSSLKAAVETLTPGAKAALDPAEVIGLAQQYEMYCTGELDEHEFSDAFKGSMDAAGVS
jgi:hypothetical protein